MQLTKGRTPRVSRCGWLLVLGLLFSPLVQAGAPKGPADVAARLSSALAQGDTAAVRGLLAKDVLIYEAGGEERSLQEYASHHLTADIGFMSSLQRVVLSQSVYQMGDGAVVATRTRLSGEYKGNTVDSRGTETLVMRHRDEGGWKIVHIHWSSE